jgi:hypothetical protein
LTKSIRIRIVPTSDDDESIWRLTREISGILESLPWVLVGGQMVAILEAEHGAKIGFATGDVDALLDVRAVVGVTLDAATRLQDAGFEPDTTGARGYRFIRGEAVVDVLAPDNVGARADLRTVPPDRTVEVIGGSQALARARVVEIDTEDEPFRIPIPTLAGAIVIKGRVASVATQDREKHERDLARLLALVPDVVALRDELVEKERGYLRKHRALLDVEHPAWRRVAGAEDGAAALAFMIAIDDPMPGGS